MSEHSSSERSSSEQNQNAVPSPCVSICALDMNDVCVGCHRTGDEITRWWNMDKAEKLATLEKAKVREKESYL